MPELLLVSSIRTSISRTKSPNSFSVTRKLFPDPATLAPTMEPFSTEYWAVPASSFQPFRLLPSQREVQPSFCAKSAAAEERKAIVKENLFIKRWLRTKGTPGTITRCHLTKKLSCHTTGCG